jgi:hypothetical protein
MKQVSKLHVPVKFTQPSLYREFQSACSKHSLRNKVYPKRKTQEHSNLLGAKASS